jgi:Bacterial PH domain
MTGVRKKPVLRVRRSGALLVAALIAFVGTVPLAGARWQLAPILLIPLAAGVWTWRAGTDVYDDALRVRALFGSTVVPWARVAALAPDQRGRVSALLDNGNVIRLTGVTAAGLPAVIAAAGQEISSPAPPD